MTVNVLTQTRQGQAAADFQDKSSLIAQIQKQIESYEIWKNAGVASSSDTFLPGASGSSVIKQSVRQDFFNALSLTGLSGAGVHVDRDTMESYGWILDEGWIMCL